MEEILARPPQETELTVWASLFWPSIIFNFTPFQVQMFVNCDILLFHSDSIACFEREGDEEAAARILLSWSPTS